MGKGSKPQQTQTQSSSSTTTANPFAMEGYQWLLGQGRGLADGASWDPATGKSVAGFTDPQFQAFADINQGIAQPFINAATYSALTGAAPISGASIANYYNPFQNDVINATQADFDRSNARALSQATGNARIAGSLGGDREAVIKALTSKELASTQNPIIANMRQQGWNTAAGLAQADAGRALQGAGVLSGLGQSAYTDTLARLQSGALQQGQTQAELDAASQNAAAKGAFPYQNLQWLAGLYGGLGPLMGSSSNSVGTSTMTGPSPNYLSQGIGLGIAALPYLGVASGGRVDSKERGLAGHMEDIAKAAKSGRQAMASGGTPMGYYVPTMALPTASLQPSGGAGMMPSGGGSTSMMQPTGWAGDVLSGIKMGSGLIKGLGEFGKNLNRTTNPNGWTTTLDYGNPLTNFTSGVSTGLSNLGSWLGFAEGGAVDDENDVGGVYDLPASAGPAPPLSGVEIVTAQPNLGVGLPVDSANPQTELRRRLDATPVPMPITDMPRIRDVPNEGQLVPTAGVAVPPPSITGDAVGSPGNPTGGVGMRPSPTPPPAATPPQSQGLLDSLSNKVKGWWDWRGSPEGEQTLLRLGSEMIKAGQQGVGPLGAFGQGLGASQEARSAYRDSQRAQDIERRKMQLLERASQLKDLEEGRTAALHPYALQEAKNKADQAKYMQIDPTKRLFNTTKGEWVKGTGDQDGLAELSAREYAKKTPELMIKSAEAVDNAQNIMRNIDDMKRLSQNMYTGAWAESRLELAKIGRLLGLDFDPSKIAAAEQYRAKMQEFVLAAAAKLKPLSNADIVFVEKGLPALARDPATIGPALESMRRIYERDALTEKYRQEYYARGRRPDNAAIEAQVNKELAPAATLVGGGQTNTGGSLSKSASSQPGGIAGGSTQARGIATQAADAQSKMQALPDGALASIGGKVYVKQGGKMVPAPKDSYTQGMSGSPYDAATWKPIPTF